MLRSSITHVIQKKLTHGKHAKNGTFQTGKDKTIPCSQPVHDITWTDAKGETCYGVITSTISSDKDSLVIDVVEYVPCFNHGCGQDIPIGYIDPAFYEKIKAQELIHKDHMPIVVKPDAV